MDISLSSLCLLQMHLSQHYIPFYNYSLTPHTSTVLTTYLLQIFARVEEESARRAQQEAEAEAVVATLTPQEASESQDDVPNPINTVSTVRQRRRGSVSVSRFGEVSSVLYFSIFDSPVSFYLACEPHPTTPLIARRTPWMYEVPAACSSTGHFFRGPLVLDY